MEEEEDLVAQEMLAHLATPHLEAIILHLQIPDHPAILMQEIQELQLIQILHQILLSPPKHHIPLLLLLVDL